MSEGRAPSPAVDEEQVGSVSQQRSTSARIQQEPPSLFEAGAGYAGSLDSVSSRAEVSFSASPAQSRLWSPQASQSSAKIQLKLQPFVKPAEVKWTDQDSPGCAQNVRSPWVFRSTRPSSPQPSTSSAGIMIEQEQPPFFDPGDMTGVHMYAQDLSMRKTSMESWEARYSSPQPSTSSSSLQFKMETFDNTDNAKLADLTGYDFALASQDIQRDYMRSWEMRTPSPQPSTSSVGMQIEKKPFVMAGNVKPPDYMGFDSSLASRDIRRDYMRSWETRTPSPQPSTSSVGMQIEKKPFVMAGNVKPPDYMGFDSSLASRDISASWERMHPWSPTASTSPTAASMSPAAKVLELELKSAKYGGGTDGTFADSFYTGFDRTVSGPSPGGGGSRFWSPQPTMMSVWPDEYETSPNFPFDRHYIDYSVLYPEIRAAPVRGKLRRWPPQQLTTAAQRAQVEMQTALEAAGATSADSELPCFAEDLSMPACERKKRPWSPQTSACTAALVQLNPMPLREAIESKADSFSMSVMHNISVLVEDKKMRTRSPQPATSTMLMEAMAGDENVAEDGSASAAAGQNISVLVGEEATPPAPDSSTLTPTIIDVEQPPVKEPAQKNPENPSVYAHVPHNISNIPQLRGLKAGRRHGRLRRLYTQNKINEKYGPMIQYFGPMVAEESAKKQTQHILIASALDHFAITINQIVDKHEGKVDTTGFTERLEELTRRMAERREMRRENNPNATEEPLPRPSTPPPPPLLSDAEINRRLREETEAAVEALLTGDRSKERPPDRFAEIIKSFQDAYKSKKY